MRSLSIFFFLLSLTLLGYLSDARNGPEEYWKSKMNGDPMPKALKDLLHNQYQDFPTQKNKRDKFLRDFDMKANIIIYHNDVDIYPKRSRPTVKDDNFSETKEAERRQPVDP
ncbi:hypothetical protein RND71_041785 [Anisodus tanguticus]|uniref:Uncharacterized protein n=1 Tax=Anisodus tanguticus TaxID=243964 RepID=A0AAE1QWC9_9SOLA|nr:hypothetical protein RND71_041785 [Anisodus tanguticus]